MTPRAVGLTGRTASLSSSRFFAATRELLESFSISARKGPRGYGLYHSIISPLEERLGHHQRRRRVANGAGPSIIHSGCRLQTDGYAGLYTPDVNLWAVIHTATDVDSKKLSVKTGRTTTTTDLKRCPRMRCAPGTSLRLCQRSLKTVNISCFASLIRRGP